MTRIRFNIDYKAEYGQQLVLHLLPEPGSQGRVTRHLLKTVGESDRRWKCEMDYAGTAPFLDYYYGVEHDGKEVRREWEVVPHRLDLNAQKGERVTAWDHWNDLPDDSYLYSSAFTECVNGRPIEPAAKAKCGKAVTLKVRAPQLGAGQRLGLLGNEPLLGDWDVERVTPMREHQPNEWTVTLNAASLSKRELEFKFMILDAEGRALMWENGDNRHVYLPSLKSGQVVAYELAQAYFAVYPAKLAGTVVPVFSLRSRGSFGVGDFGDLKAMIDWVASTGQRVLQVLPINDTTITGTWTDSYPYNSISIYALHPMYADLRQLPALADEDSARRLEALRQELNALPQIDYERMMAAKHEWLRLLFAQEGASVLRSDGFKEFFEAGKHWLVPYAAFCHYRDEYGTACFGEWPAHHTLTAADKAQMSNPRTKLYKQVSYWYYVQYILHRQMLEAHLYAREHHVVLKGDIPIGISRDGVEAWVEPGYFNLNGQAGAPPDAFSVNGQNWGFPTYNWDAMLADGCSWWVRRLRHMSTYFDAYRIDHVLGFFRIWEIPVDAVHGLLGHFSPALGFTADEIRGYGLNFQEPFMTEPFISDHVLDRVFGTLAGHVRETYVEHLHDDIYRMRPEWDTQRKIEAAFQGRESANDRLLRDGLMALVSDVLFVRDHRNPGLFHPRISVQYDFVYQTLYEGDKEAFNRLYNDYYYRRNTDYWYQEAMRKLPALVQATRMLVCAEDLGMVPDCVPWALNELRILSLEIQSMPKDTHLRFGNLSANPYRSVATISTHDMSTLRQWWDEDIERTQDYYNTVMWHSGAAPHPLPGRVAADVVRAHLSSPSMLCLLSLQDWLAMDDGLRLPDAAAERINVPANPRHYWRYRMHLTLEDLMQATDFNRQMKTMISQSGRQ